MNARIELDLDRPVEDQAILTSAMAFHYFHHHTFQLDSVPSNLVGPAQDEAPPLPLTKTQPEGRE